MPKNPMTNRHPRSYAHLCKAHARTGLRCRRPAIPGGVVCRFHGGAAPQVKQAAAVRLAALVDPAIDRLTKLLAEKRDKKVALGAVRDVLDRNNLSGKTKLEHSGKDGAPIAFTLRLNNDDDDR